MNNPSSEKNQGFAVSTQAHSVEGGNEAAKAVELNSVTPTRNLIRCRTTWLTAGSGIETEQGHRADLKEFENYRRLVQSEDIGNEV